MYQISLDNWNLIKYYSIDTTLYLWSLGKWLRGGVKEEQDYLITSQNDDLAIQHSIKICLMECWIDFLIYKFRKVSLPTTLLYKRRACNTFQNLT